MIGACPKPVVIITGATGGIGEAIVDYFIEKNHIVHGIDSRISANPRDPDLFHAHQLDVTQFEELAGFFKEASNTFFSPTGNILINCAGIREISSIEDLTLPLWEKVFATNVTATFIASKYFCQTLVKKGLPGSIVNIASTSGVLGEPNRCAYVSSKHAVIGLTKQFAIEYGKNGIRVNAVAPGVVRTPMTEVYFQDPHQIQKIDNGQFIQHKGMPLDIAHATYFLASSQARFITGSTLVIDGGWTAGKQL